MCGHFLDRCHRVPRFEKSCVGNAYVNARPDILSSLTFCHVIEQDLHALAKKEVPPVRE